jgi:hypothetical protein
MGLRGEWQHSPLDDSLCSLDPDSSFFFTTLQKQMAEAGGTPALPGRHSTTTDLIRDL